MARRSGLAATTAARALKSLHVEGLVEQSSETIAAGRAREMKIWRANLLHPRWPDLDPILARVERPQRRERRERAAGRVPRRLRHLFWNTAESQLDVASAGPYIARRLLRMMDVQGLAWGAKMLRAEDWERAALARGLDPKGKRLALSIAGFQDPMAMKLKVMAERGEMRDYFDVRTIDERGSISVEEGIELYMRRYGVAPGSDAIPHLYRAMGNLSDVEADDLVPADLAELQRWWSMRQVRVLRNSDRFG